VDGQPASAHNLPVLFIYLPITPIKPVYSEPLSVTVPSQDHQPRLVLVQCALSDAQQETVAHILESDMPASQAYVELKAELTRMHVKSSWDRMAELHALPPCGGQNGTELLAAMERLKPEEPELWFHWMYFSRLPDWIQRQLAEDTSPVRELAKRVDELQRKAPPAATVAAVPAPAAEIAAVEQSRPPKKSWGKKKADDRKRRRTDDGGQGGQGDAKQKPGPRASIGIC